MPVDAYLFIQLTRQNQKYCRIDESMADNPHPSVEDDAVPKKSAKEASQLKRS